MAYIGYARVSTQDQNLDAQLESLKVAGCSKIFYGKQSGKSSDNTALLNELVDYCRDGDVVLVTKLDRLGRSLNAIITVIQQLQEKGVQVRTLDGQVNTESDNAMQRAMTQLLGVFAELEHSIIVDRLQSGRERTGRKGGRTPSLTPEQRNEVVRLHKEGISKAKLAVQFDVSRATIMRVVAD